MLRYTAHQTPSSLHANRETSLFPDGGGIQRLHGDGSGQGVGHWGAAQSDPDGQLISTNLLRGTSRSGRGGSWEGNWDLHRARVSSSGDGDTSELAGLIVVAKVGLAGIKSHAVLELDCGVVMRDGDDWPCSESGQFLEDGLDPGLEETEVARLTADCGRWHVGGSHVGLVEHECVMSEGQQMTNVGGSGIVEQNCEVVGASRGGHPFSDGASWSVAVVVDGGGLELVSKEYIAQTCSQNSPIEA